VAYAPDGRLLACGDSYGAVYFWDLASFTPRFVFGPGPEPRVWEVAFSPAGGRLLIEDHLYDAAPLVQAPRQGPQRRAGGAGPEPLLLPEVRLQDEDQTDLTPPALSLVFTPDGKAVVGRTGTPWSPSPLRQWGPDGRLQRTVVHPQWAYPLAFSPDGRAVALAQADAALGLWDWAAGAEVAVLKHTARVHYAAFTPDGRLLASAAGQTVRLWDVSSRECVARFPAFHGRTFGLALHPRGRLLAAGSMDGTVRLWDVTAAREVERYDWQVGAIRRVAFSPDGMTAAAAGHKKTVVVWDVDDLAG
jgi:WD40 repeat protein